MANSGAGDRQATRLCLVVTADAGVATAERLSAALGAADVASVILRAGAGRMLEAGTVRPLVAAIQRAGVAVLIADDARLARTLKADGVHLSASADVEAVFAEAREVVGSGVIAGMDAGLSKHAAMSLGEAGADYVAFGLFDGADVAARDERIDRVGWWAEIFQPPCVVLDVASPEEAAALADVGADFVAVTLPEACSVADARDLVVAFAAAVTLAESVG